MTDVLIEVRDLYRHFPVRRGVLRRQVGAIRAVDGVSLEIHRGETVGLVGESGSGKSTIGRTVLRLLTPTRGQVIFDGTDLGALSRHQLRGVRPRLQMVFQDPYASLNPRLTIGATVLEALEVNAIGGRAWRRQRVGELFELVGLDPRFVNRYPHELSGGQRQRVGIARALATDPAFVVADEAIAALDVSIQAQIVNLLGDLRDTLGLTYLFISHDLSMARHISDRIVVLYLGKVVEVGPADEVCRRPRHPYTVALLSAVPVPDPEREARRERLVLTGDMPSPADPPRGCRFHTRCPFATDLCLEQEPTLRNGGAGWSGAGGGSPAAGTAGPGEAAPHLAACHHSERIAEVS
jgi:oligopeptide transport system ATP-binding protein